jgi:site-specific DNA-cytosine methylase
MMKPVVVVDLFAGAGGFTEGALAAGAKVAVAIDLWEPAVLLHRHNQPNVLMVQHELGNLRRDVQLIRKYLARYPNHHIHLHGSPPCQALSNASRTDASEGMGMIHHFLDLVDAIQPDSWSMENVVPMRKRLPEGTPSIILNSADFGVSQTRRRCIAGEGWEAIPTHSKEEWRSVLDALPHLAEELIGLVPAPSMTKQYQNASIEKPFPTVTSSSPRQLRMMINMVGGGSSPNRRVSSSDAPIDGPSKTVTGSSGAPSLRLEAMGSNAKRQADRAIDEPSKTICGSGDQVGPRIFDRSDTPVKIRSLTVQETATLQGFPATFEWELPGLRKKDIWTAIGNAVCPPVAEAIIRGIIQ